MTELSLETIMPNGKKLGDCTGDEVAVIGKLYELVGFAAQRVRLRWNPVTETAPKGKKLLVLITAEQSIPLEYAIAILHRGNVWRSVPVIANDTERDVGVHYWMELPEIPQTTEPGK